MKYNIKCFEQSELQRTEYCALYKYTFSTVPGMTSEALYKYTFSTIPTVRHVSAATIALSSAQSTLTLVSTTPEQLPVLLGTTANQVRPSLTRACTVAPRYNALSYNANRL